ncbi:MAG: hypothetical protein LBK00_11050 [Treponema sp.]|jgi:hypothetical protein|nr:hypothetical protein [Treponema sp.]
MATLNFLRGSIKGKLGQLVGSSWRGKGYIKTYTPPSNPNAQGQAAVRTIFQRTAHIAKAIYESALKPYTFSKPQKLTAYNRMIQINKTMFNELLFNPWITSATIKGHGTPAVAVKVTFAAILGDRTDKAIAVLRQGTGDARLPILCHRPVARLRQP